jgi:1,2-dihydroxy-3-keto-5-methylthiopentene dioxygenase
MTSLVIRPADGGAPVRSTDDWREIVALLAKEGVRFERWPAAARLAASAGQDEILAAYTAEIERLKREGGYQTADVTRLTPDHPDRVTLRGKFLSEHTHGEDEVRFFVEGGGTFFIHLSERVFEIRCTRDDLLLVPAKTKHWFDMGERPHFTAIRLFTNPEGWLAAFTGDAIASRFVAPAA